MDFKEFSKKYQTEIYLVMFLILVGIISFNLGRIWTISRYGQPPRVEQANLSEIFKPNANLQIDPNTTNVTNTEKEPRINFKVVASKNSTKYHYTWCSGAKRIKPENLITFTSEEEAQAKGYILAGNCKK